MELINKIIKQLNQSPESFKQTSGVSGAKTYLIEMDDTFYLKVWEKNRLKADYQTLCFFSKLGFTAAPLSYKSSDKDYLLTKEIKGLPASSEQFLQNPKRLATELGKILRRFHDMINIDNCPFSNSVSDMLARVVTNYKNKEFDLRLASYVNNTDIDNIYSYIMQHKDCLINDVVLHGDYCLPNILLKDNFELSGLLDMGAAGIGDRHYDLFWGRWSLQYNLKSDKYCDDFFSAYGKELIDSERLKVIGYISCMD